ncbi:epoxide hydrolase family protein [Actinoplanes sp. NPDC049118]|uniref:epoxide hydrolase family protein n=1 Tax=Actinoplanes sp. NPDC049118 TaxID=3155769 RepID=UPI0033FC208A
MHPFRVHVPQSDLDDLADRLARTRWPDELPGAGWDYGIPLSRVRDLAERWRTGYDWRAHEAALNGYPQFVTEIDGQRVHFLHVRSANPAALPLVLVHGWPGSVLEFLDMVEPLTGHFHLVIPSIPGFGFSGPTAERGWDQQRIARAFAELMTRLGYPRFGAQGGDWGSGIARALGAVAPERVVGVHVNYLPTPGPSAGLSGTDRERAERTAAFAANRPGYQVLQATRPQTISYALTDSPVGQLAWIAEKFTEWADPASTIGDDVLLTDVSIYWFTRTAGSSARLAKESGYGASCPVPMGVAVLPHDIVQSVRPLAERGHDIRHWSELPRGGHFAALEVPGDLAADVIAFFAGLAPRAA